ncbi:hypothetical protein HWA77_16860 [Photobacterium damselae subsp. damselae]|uniref:Uncharacterized protein n=1 Tax=Photobacterium damselae subsp. damselae TaxID=85581 RepID=A0A850QQH7_PHODD|nr:hypothetical protein [Photobacterium damselae subsp. damselae]
MDGVTILILGLLTLPVIIYFSAGHVRTPSDLILIMTFCLIVMYGLYKVNEASKATVSQNATVYLKCGDTDCIYKGKLTKKGDLYTLVTEDNKDVSFKSYNYISVDSNVAIKDTK